MLTSITISSDTAPSAVLDTNVLLDWLVFGNPRLEPLVRALEARRLRWLATDSMRDELAHVLARGLGGRWTIDDARWREAWLQRAELVPAPVAPLHVPRCTDPDDQKFIDLAIVAQARWLVTRDRALLRLARRSRRYGLEVLTPEAWNAAAGEADAP